MAISLPLLGHVRNHSIVLRSIRELNIRATEKNIEEQSGRAGDQEVLRSEKSLQGLGQYIVQWQQSAFEAKHLAVSDLAQP